MKLENQDIIIVSNEPWEDIWFSKHYYAHELSIKNKVLFFNPPGKWEAANFFSKKIHSKKISANLEIVNYQNYFPFTLKFSIINYINNFLIYKLINTFLKKAKKQNIIFWSFDPYRLHHPAKLNAHFSIYHCMDYYKNNEEVLLWKNVDLIISVSKQLIDRFPKIIKPFAIIPHGIVDSLLPVGNEYYELQNNVVLIGSIGHRTDYELLCKFAEKFKNYTLKIIGKIDKNNFSENDTNFFNQLEKLNNVIFTGAMPFGKLQDEIIKSKLCLCCYKGSNISSLKIMQYIALGKPVISTYMQGFDIPEIKDFVCLTKSHEEFLTKAEHSINLGNTPELREKRINYSREFTYSKLILKIENEIELTLKLKKDSK